MNRSTELKTWILSGLLLGLPAGAGAVPFPDFEAGNPIVADQVDANFADLEQRMAAIEDGDNQTVPVDCTADPNAFLDPNPVPITDNTTYMLKGMCNGPIEIFRVRNVIFEGDPAGVPKDDGIVLPPGLTDDPFAAVGVWEGNAELRNLTIDATNYNSNSYPWNPNGTVSAVTAAQMGILRIYDTDVRGGDYGLNVYRKGWLKTYSNVNITEFNLTGVSSFESSHVQLSETIQVIGGLSTTDQYPDALGAAEASTIDIRNGGTFTPAGSGSGDENYAIFSGDNSSVRATSGGPVILNGDLLAMRGGSIRVFSGATITGYIGAYDGATIRVEGSTHSGGLIESGRNSAIRIQDSSDIDGDLSAFDSGTIRLTDSTHTGSVINASDSGVIKIQNSTFAGQISPGLSSSINISNSNRVGSDDIYASENSSIVVDNTPINAASIYISDSSTLTLRNNSDHSGGDISASESSTIRLDGIDFAGNIDSNNGSAVLISSSNQVGLFSIEAHTNSSIFIEDTSDVSFLTSNTGSTVQFEGAFIETLGTANAYTGATLVINQTTVAGQIDASTNSTISLNEVTQTANGIFLNVGAIADISNSSIGFTETINGTVLQINDGAVAGVRISHGSAASIYGASVTSDIGVDGPSSNLHITDGSNDGTGPGTLNGNTIYLCGNATSYIGPFIGPTGIVSNACEP